jgi:hypothetical protein
VTNLATDLFSQLGFESIYLIGVDLGFISKEKHHSSFSSYYNSDGKERYDFAERNNTSLKVPGNFRSWVGTKPEFKIARQIMVQAIAANPNKTDYYNCGDGAKIDGASPLPVDNILISTPQGNKPQVLAALKNNCYKIPEEKYEQVYKGRYPHARLQSELNRMQTFIEAPVSTFEEAKDYIEDPKNLLFNFFKTGHSLLLFYMFGSLNFANAMLTKLLYSSSEREKAPEAFLEGKRLWEEAFQDIKKSLESPYNNMDTCSAMQSTREKLLLKKLSMGKNVLLFTNSDAFAMAMHNIHNHFQLTSRFTVQPISAIEQTQEVEFDTVIYHCNTALDHGEKVNAMISSREWPITGKDSTLVIAFDAKQLQSLPATSITGAIITYIPVVEPSQDDNRKFLSFDHLCLSNFVVRLAYANLQSRAVLIHYMASQELNKKDFDHIASFNAGEDIIAIEFSDHTVLYDTKTSEDDLVNPNNVGTRGTRLHSLTLPSERMLVHLDLEAFKSIARGRVETIPHLHNDCYLTPERIG